MELWRRYSPAAEAPVTARDEAFLSPALAIYAETMVDTTIRGRHQDLHLGQKSTRVRGSEKPADSTRHPEIGLFGAKLSYHARC